jgi:hypothetical protein
MSRTAITKGMIVISNRVRNSRVGLMLTILPMKKAIKTGVSTTLTQSKTTVRIKARALFPFDISVHIIGVPAGHETTPTTIKPTAKPGESEKNILAMKKQMTGISAKAKKMVIIILRNSKALDIIFSILCVITDRKTIKPARKAMNGFKMGPSCGIAKPAKTITKNNEMKIVFWLSFMIPIAILPFSPFLF